ARSRMGPHGVGGPVVHPRRASAGIARRRSDDHPYGSRVQPPRRPPGLPARNGARVNVLELDALAVDLPVEGRLRRVIHEVTLNVAESQAVGLVGESGAGKSMTSRAVIRLLPAGAMIHGDI